MVLKGLPWKRYLPFYFQFINKLLPPFTNFFQRLLRFPDAFETHREYTRAGDYVVSYFTFALASHSNLSILAK